MKTSVVAMIGGAPGFKWRWPTCTGHRPASQSPIQNLLGLLAPMLRLAPAGRLTLREAQAWGMGFQVSCSNGPKMWASTWGRWHSQGHPHISPDPRPCSRITTTLAPSRPFTGLSRTLRLEPRPQDVSPRQGPAGAGTLIHGCGHRRRGKETSRCGMAG